GNYGGQPLLGQITLFPPRSIVTDTMAGVPQRYFVAYHITPTALPTDVITQQARTVGIELRNTSFPTNSPLFDDPLQNAISAPNALDPSSPLPFVSEQRAIIASPRTVYVKATPYYSTSSGTFAAPLLTAQ